MSRSIKLFGAFVLNIFIAPITLSKVATKIYVASTDRLQNQAPFWSLFSVLFGSCVAFCILQYKFDWSWAIALFAYLSFCGCLATVRKRTREKLNISGHIVEDFVSSMLLYPSVVVQMDITLKETLDSGMGAKTYIFDAPI